MAQNQQFEPERRLRPTSIHEGTQHQSEERIESSKNHISRSFQMVKFVQPSFLDGTPLISRSILVPN